MSDPIRVLIVDDSALLRKVLSDLLSNEPGIEVAGKARDAAEAIDLTRRLKPDVITLDVAMPGMSGIEALPALLDAHGARVLMVSSLTQEGAAITLEALELGAVDFMPKPDRHQLTLLREAKDHLAAKVRAAAQSKVVRGRRADDAPARTRAASKPPPRERAEVAGADRALACAAIGISTGGPQALSRVFRELEPPMCPIVVVQHMPARFTAVFAERLNQSSGLEIAEARDGERISPGRVYIAPGGRHMTVIGSPYSSRIHISDGPPVSGHRPSIDALFRSVAATFRSATTGIIMTGMGRDGVVGCKTILAAGGATLAQDEASSVVYGMNKAAIVEGAAAKQFSLEELPELLSRMPVYAAVEPSPTSRRPSSQPEDDEDAS